MATTFWEWHFSNTSSFDNIDGALVIKFLSLHSLWACTSFTNTTLLSWQGGREKGNSPKLMCADSVVVLRSRSFSLIDNFLGFFPCDWLIYCVLKWLILVALPVFSLLLWESGHWDLYSTTSKLISLCHNSNNNNNSHKRLLSIYCMPIGSIRLLPTFSIWS